MEWSSTWPVLVTAVAGLIASWLTHKRATKAHGDSYLLDRQQLINDTYEKILEQLRTENQRREDIHKRERTIWEEKERELQARIRNLESRIQSMQLQMDELYAREMNVQRAQSRHVRDSTRHLERRDHSRLPEDEEGADGSV